ncbi:MAG: glycosyltransferase family 4 protein [Anaerolineae bacterium]|nr:glycosyltransferase family 4 protein [Anaerolineae bacterium]
MATHLTVEPVINPPARRFRILMLAPTGFFADYGCHVRIRGHARALVARGHEVLIVTYPGGRDVPGLAITRAPGWPRGREMPVGSAWRKVALDALLAPTAWAAAYRFRPDLIHAYLHEGALIGAILSRRYRIPLLFDFQGSLTGEMLDHRFVSPRSPFLPALRRLERWIDLRPQAILPSSAHAAGLLAHDFGVPQKRIHPLLDSVDAGLFRPAADMDVLEKARLRTVLSLPPERPVVVYLGLLAAYQGTDTLLRAIKSLDIQPKPVFLIMGFPSVDHYQGMAEGLGLAADTRFTGAIPYEDAPVYLSLGDVAVAPKQSATEGSGKLLPYMATALPVVASDLPVHREYLGELGYYFPTGDAPAMAAAIAGVLADPKGCHERGRALRARVVARFSWQHAAVLLEQTYQACLDSTLPAG